MTRPPEKPKGLSGGPLTGKNRGRQAGWGLSSIDPGFHPALTIPRIRGAIMVPSGPFDEDRGKLEAKGPRRQTA